MLKFQGTLAYSLLTCEGREDTLLDSEVRNNLTTPAFPKNNTAVIHQDEQVFMELLQCNTQSFQCYIQSFCLHGAYFLEEGIKEKICTCAIDYRISKNDDATKKNKAK